MKKGAKKIKIDKIYLIFVRYIILLGFVLSLPIIYKVLTPLTLYPVKWLLELIYENIAISKNIISINGTSLVELIPACIAGSAYLLLLILNLSVSMNVKKRIYSILSSFLILLILNILRIFFLIILYHNESPFFDITHKLFWYGLSTVFVVGIWFLEVKKFSIKETPVYSDIKYFVKEIKIK